MRKGKSCTYILYTCENTCLRYVIWNEIDEDEDEVAVER